MFSNTHKSNRYPRSHTSRYTFYLFNCINCEYKLCNQQNRHTDQIEPCPTAVPYHPSHIYTITSNTSNTSLVLATPLNHSVIAPSSTDSANLHSPFSPSILITLHRYFHYPYSPISYLPTSLSQKPCLLHTTNDSFSPISKTPPLYTLSTHTFFSTIQNNAREL